MLELLTHQAINRQQWDACITASPQGIIYALSWYLDVVSPGWQAIVDKDGEQYRAVMPLPVDKKMGIPYIRQPLFCQQLGIFTRDQAPEAAYLDRFLQLLLSAFRYIASYHFNTHNYSCMQLLPRAGFSYRELSTHELELKQGYAAIRQGYKRGCRWKIRRAHEYQQQVTEGRELAPLLEFFRRQVAGKIPGGVAREAYIKIEQLTRRLLQNQTGKILYSTGPEGHISAGGIFLFFKNKTIYLFCAASKEGRKQQGRSLLIDYVLQLQAAKPGIFDFESPEDQQVRDFYEGFGAKPVSFHAISCNRLPALIKLIKKAKFYIYKKLLRKKVAGILSCASPSHALDFFADGDGD